MINFYFYFISLPFTFDLPVLYTILCSAYQCCVHGNHASRLYRRAGVALLALERQEVRELIFQPLNPGGGRSLRLRLRG